MYTHYCSLYNHYEDGSLRSVTDMKGYQKIAIAFNGGTSEHWNNSDKVRSMVYFILIFALLAANKSKICINSVCSGGLCTKYFLFVLCILSTILVLNSYFNLVPHTYW